MNTKIHSFTDLNAWKESHMLVLQIYKITKEFSADEKFGLVDQMRRCAVSISSNIAEGFFRRTKKEKAQFFYMALGSLTELQNQLLISRDLTYIDNKTFTDLAEQTVTISKLVNGLVKSSRNFNT
ncbi:MAG: four helix bundle protein [Candidatus Levybacteria bacterium]|nr:four helix bundle protein [Candidatus Levybacteria bacterium]MBP9815037.1 four helix bundle protein [Candidatus Levybacteria bacterium]